MASPTRPATIGWSDRADHGAGGADQTRAGPPRHRQHLRPQRYHQVGPRLGTQRLADLRQTAGQERRPVEALQSACARHQVEWFWVKGHSGVADNELADELATRGMQEAIAYSVRAPGGAQVGRREQPGSDRRPTVPLVAEAGSAGGRCRYDGFLGKVGVNSGLPQSSIIQYGETTSRSSSSVTGFTGPLVGIDALSKVSTKSGCPRSGSCDDRALISRTRLDGHRVEQVCSR